MKFEIVTIFPDYFTSILSYGVLGRAVSAGLVGIDAHDLRAYTHDRHRTVDDRPFGGGEGMVLKPEPIFDCCETLHLAEKGDRDPEKETVILLSAQGTPFTQDLAHELAAVERVVFICGRYEGVDERVNEILCDREISIGDYVLSGGELAAAVVIDAIVRLLPGVLGNANSSVHESFGAPDAGAGHRPGAVPPSTHGAGGLLDYPHYTRPASFRGYAVPEVLAQGDHAQIRRWRREQSLAKTYRNRPDLLARAALSATDRAYLATLR